MNENEKPVEQTVQQPVQQPVVEQPVVQEGSALEQTQQILAREEANKKKKNIIIIIVLVVAVLAIAGGVVFAVNKFSDAKSDDDTHERASKKDKNEDKEESKKEEEPKEEEEAKEEKTKTPSYITADGKAFSVSTKDFADTMTTIFKTRNNGITITTEYEVLDAPLHGYPNVYETHLSNNDVVYYYSNDGGKTTSAVSYVFTESGSADQGGFFMGAAIAGIIGIFDTQELISIMGDNQCFSAQLCEFEFKGIAVRVRVLKSDTADKYDWLSVDLAPANGTLPDNV